MEPSEETGARPRDDRIVDATCPERACEGTEGGAAQGVHDQRAQRKRAALARRDHSFYCVAGESSDAAAERECNRR